MDKLKNNDILILKGTGMKFSILTAAIICAVLSLVCRLFKLDFEIMKYLSELLIGVAQWFSLRYLINGDGSIKDFKKARIFLCVNVALQFVIFFVMYRKEYYDLRVLSAVQFASLAISVCWGIFEFRGYSKWCKQRDDRLAKVFGFLWIAFPVEAGMVIVSYLLFGEEITEVVAIIFAIAVGVVYYVCLKKVINLFDVEERKNDSRKYCGFIWVMVAILLVAEGTCVGLRVYRIDRAKAKILNYYNTAYAEDAEFKTYQNGYRPNPNKSYDKITAAKEIEERSNDPSKRGPVIVEITADNITKVDGQLVYPLTERYYGKMNLSNQNNEKYPFFFDNNKWKNQLFVLTLQDGGKIGAIIPNFIYEQELAKAEGGIIELPLAQIYEKSYLQVLDLVNDLSDIYSNGGSKECLVDFAAGFQYEIDMHPYGVGFYESHFRKLMSRLFGIHWEEPDIGTYAYIIDVIVLLFTVIFIVSCKKITDKDIV